MLDGCWKKATKKSNKFKIQYTNPIYNIKKITQLDLKKKITIFLTSPFGKALTQFLLFLYRWLKIASPINQIFALFLPLFPNKIRLDPLLYLPWHSVQEDS